MDSVVSGPIGIDTNLQVHFDNKQKKKMGSRRNYQDIVKWHNIGFLQSMTCQKTHSPDQWFWDSIRNKLPVDKISFKLYEKNITQVELYWWPSKEAELLRYQPIHI